MSRFLSVVAVLFGLAGMGATYFVWTDYQGELRRVSSELAQMKVSVQLLAQRPAAVANPDVVEPTPVDDADAKAIEELSTRIGALEEAARTAVVASTTPADEEATALAALPPAEDTTEAENGDCIPQGTRFVLTPGDAFLVCGATVSLTLNEVGEGVADIAGIGPVMQGSMGKLKGSSCNVALLSTMVDGFAEIRVNC